MSKIFGSLSFLLQAALVAGGVVVFSFFDPFGLFKPKLKLKNTPVSVESMREIGELITAEYYGEVIASTMETVEIKADTAESEFKQSLDSLHYEFIDVIDQLDEAAEDDVINRKRRLQIRTYFEKNLSEITQRDWYQVYTRYLWRKYVDGTVFTEKDLDKGLNRVQLGNLLREVLKAGVMERIENDNRSTLIAAFSNELKTVEAKKHKKRQLVLLGRGWVKAGFRFGEFNADNFSYDSQNKRLAFIGLQPEILSETINPWFIPEKGIEGFEFLIVERKARRDYSILLEVKELCLAKLKEKAYRADILEEAEKNAKAQLKSFFELLIGEDIRDVTFYNDVLDYTRVAVLGDDNVIEREGFGLINRAIEKANAQIESGEFDEDDIRAFISGLQAETISYRLFDTTRHKLVNPYLSLMYDIGNDGILLSTDRQKLLNANPANKEYKGLIKYWYKDEATFKVQATKDFDEALELLRSHLSRILTSKETVTYDDQGGDTLNARYNCRLDSITSLSNFKVSCDAVTIWPVPKDSLAAPVSAADTTAVGL